MFLKKIDFFIDMYMEIYFRTVIIAKVLVFKTDWNKNTHSKEIVSFRLTVCKSSFKKQKKKQIFIVVVSLRVELAITITMTRFEQPVVTEKRIFSSSDKRNLILNFGIFFFSNDNNK